MLRLEVACFLVTAFMAVLYFSAKREQTKYHKVFSTLLILSMLHLIFDGATVYTVNHLETVPLWLNNVLHKLFVGTMVAIFFLVHRYILLMVEEETGKRSRLLDYGIVVLVLVLLGTAFLPIYYMEHEQVNYSYGPAAYMTYVTIAAYLFGIGLALARNWKEINPKKRFVIGIAFLIEFLISLYQAVYPTALMSGMGIMLLVLSFYLTMENPDIYLAQQVELEKRKAQEANEAKNVFLSNMSHEIRTPMNTIVGMTEVLLRSELTDEQKEYLDNVRSSGHALLSLINDILDISKIEAGKMELLEDAYEFRRLLQDMKLMVQNRIGTKPISFVCDVDEEIPPYLYGDELRIRQILINLLGNAVKFTESGTITLAIRRMECREEAVALRISVTDTGQGIPENEIHKLFGTFQQVDVIRNKGKEGTGLGLAICSRLIDKMGGRLEVTSRYGVGSEFFFTIYQGIAQGVATVAEDAEDMAYRAPEAQILLVDDNSMNRKVALRLLEPLQLQIDTAEDGRQALEMIGQKQYHMVLMDHMMPVMDGIEATRLLRQKEEAYYQNLPVIALTANAMKEAEKLFYEAGMNGFVAKPIEMKEICRVIRKWLPRQLVLPAEPVIQSKQDEDVSLTIPGLDVKEGIKNSGSKELFLSLLGDFYRLIDVKELKIERFLEDGFIKDYTIEVHALKNTARLIGAMELSREFEHLEQAGHDETLMVLQQDTSKVLEHYRNYKQILAPYNSQAGMEKRVANSNELMLYLQGIRDCVEGFDLDGVDDAMEQLEDYQLPENCEKDMEALRVAVADVAMEDILRIVQKIMQELTEK
ncbi:MAG: response regulator [Lachnospiraceae bacterium]|nr:response regulator [Lachnospiraceae bacterium]